MSTPPKTIAPKTIAPKTIAPQTISREAWTQPGADYEALRAQAIALVQAMSGDIWTDYNYSDPGVTILEQLCYALTELPYRASFPVQELLSPPDERQLPLRRQGLFPVWSILPCNPVTANDLRRLVIDRVPEVANVWFTPRRGKDPAGLSGLYEVAILRHDHDGGGDWGGDDGDRGAERLVDAATRCYGAHRGLCEDILKPRILSRLDTRVHAWVTIADNADPSDTLAQILFSLGLFLAPEPRRTSLDDRIGSGARTADIFFGTLMLRGFIPDQQLTPLPSDIRVDQLRQVLAGAPGVATVDRLSVTLDGQHDRFTDKDRIAVPPNTVLRLQATERHGQPTIRMIRNRKSCQPDEARTRHRLAELWRQQRRVYPLRDEYASHYAPPAAHYRDLSSYASIQNQFPAIYGIGADGLPSASSATRQAQARQLKGYLMPFDQLLADGFSQLAFVRDLFSIEAGGDATYAVQSLRPIVPGADALLKPGYEAGLASLSAETDPVDRRRNAILDLLLSFYAATLSAPKGAMEEAADNGGHGTALIHAKQSMLRRMASTTRNRGKGLDYRRPGSERSMSGVERMSRLQLGLITLAAEGAADGAADGAAEAGNAASGASAHPDDPVAVRNPAEASFGSLLPLEVLAAVEGHFRTVEEGEEDAGAATWRRRSPLAGQRVASSLLGSLHDRSRYRLVRMRDTGTLIVVCIDVNQRGWIIGEYTSEIHAQVVVRELIWAAGQHRRRNRRRHDLYIVEWLLLRHGHKSGAGGGQRYNFRISAVLAADGGDGDSESWRSQSRDTLRDNTPAHIALDCLFLDHRPMERFRDLYDAWVEALRHGSPARRAKTSHRLESFLVEHGSGPPPDQRAPDQGVPDQGVPDQGPPDQGTAAPARPADPSGGRPGGAAKGGPPSGDAPRSRPSPNPPARPRPAPVPEPSPEPAPASVPETPPPPPPPSPDAGASGVTTAAPATGSGSRSFWSRLRGVLSRSKRGAASTESSAAPAATPPAPDQPAPDGTPETTDRTRGTRSRRGTAKTQEPAPSTPSAQPQATATQATATASDGATGVQAAPPGAIGFDTDTVLTADSAGAFRAKGFTFALRYVSLGSPEAEGDLTAGETAAILGAGLALMAVQHVPAAGWVPSRSLGQTRGEAAAANAAAAGLPPEICLWLDLEGVAEGTDPDTIIQYCNAWFAAVDLQGYLPGLYVGANCGLDGGQLSTSLNCAYFWQSGSDVPAFETPGYCMVQTIDSDYEIGGVTYDSDTIQADGGGKTPVWAAIASD